MSKAQRKAKTIKLVIAENHRVITKDEIARRAYALLLARGQVEGRDVEDWLEAERQLEAESIACRPQLIDPSLSVNIGESCRSLLKPVFVM